MQQNNLDALANRWFPVARVEEIVYRHVFQAQLLGQELAIWRDDAGALNAWENRCAHRGVRLSIGMNTGTELRCQYHGWRYSSQTGQCTFIPAHPDRKPASVIRAKAHGCCDRYGYVWVNLSEESARLPMPTLSGDAFTTFRSIHIHAPIDRVSSIFDASCAPESGAAETAPTEKVLRVQGTTDANSFDVHLRLVPMSLEQTIVHGYLTRKLAVEERLEMFRLQDERLTEIRDVIESGS